MTKKAEFGKTTYAEAVETFAVYAALLAVCLVMPLLLKYLPSGPIAGNEQWIMGPIVNCALVLVGVRFHGFWKTAGAVVLPSAVHIINFYMFAIGTAEALYLLPAVWAGNLAVVLAFKNLYTNKKIGFVRTAAIAVAVKVGIIFAVYYLLTAAGSVTVMPVPVNQLFVALIGCAMAYGFTAHTKKSIK